LTREHVASHTGDDEAAPIGYGSEDFLEYFDVFYPFADENLTLELYDSPRYRAIAAQLLVRRVAYTPPFAEDLIPMDPRGEDVEISNDSIRVGGPLFKYTFKYSFVATSYPPRLILESKHTRITFIKWSSTAGDLQSSWIRHPIYFYPPDALAALAARYERLRAENKH
jgi:hypothetical protein